MSAANSFTGDYQRHRRQPQHRRDRRRRAGQRRQCDQSEQRAHAQLASGTISASRTVNLVSGIGNIQGSGLGGEFYTGAGGMNVGDGIALTNNANNYQGQTQFTTLPSWGGDSQFLQFDRRPGRGERTWRAHHRGQRHHPARAGLLPGAWAIRHLATPAPATAPTATGISGRATMPAAPSCTTTAAAR